MNPHNRRLRPSDADPPQHTAPAENAAGPYEACVRWTCSDCGSKNMRFAGRDGSGVQYSGGIHCACPKPTPLEALP